MVKSTWRIVAITLSCLLIFLVGIIIRQRKASEVRLCNLNTPDVVHDHTFADIIEAVAPSVVDIDVTGKNNMRRSVGAGIIIRSDGYILTSRHILDKYSVIKVKLDANHSYPACVVGEDGDLAVIKIDSINLPALDFDTAKTVRSGDRVIAIGSPLGLDHSVTSGIVSAVDRSIHDPSLKDSSNLIQTDAAINPGNSGGPLLNIDGKIIGIITAIRSDAQNISFAIPADQAKKVATEIISKAAKAQ